MGEEKRGISRRSFIKGIAVGAAGIAAAGTLGGCGQESATTSKTSSKVAGEPGKASFEVPPPPIPEKDIKQTVTADVVVCGGGLAGMCAAISAAQAGAKVVLLEKGSITSFRGIDYGAIGSSIQKLSGAKVDKAEAVREIMRWGGYKADQRVVSLWANYSGAAVDWLLDLAKAAGQTIKPVPLEHQIVPNSTIPYYTTQTFELIPNEKPLLLHQKGNCRGKLL